MFFKVISIDTRYRVCPFNWPYQELEEIRGYENRTIIPVEYRQFT